MSNTWWKGIFKPLLIIINLLFFGLTLLTLNDPTGFTFYGILPFVLLIGIIDFITVFSYIHRRQPHGKANIKGDIALIVIGFVIILAGVLCFALLGPELMVK